MQTWRQERKPTMSQSEPAKKIVSKREYVQIQSQRTGKMLSGMVLLAAGVGSAVFTLCLGGFALTLSDGEGYRGPGPFVILCAAVLSGVMTYGFGTLGTTQIKEAEQMKQVVPLTKANASSLSAQESFVRASTEPLIAPETTLLRAATDNSTTLPEQMVRPSGAPECTGRMNSLL